MSIRDKESRVALRGKHPSMHQVLGYKFRIIFNHVEPRTTQVIGLDELFKQIKR